MFDEIIKCYGSVPTNATKIISTNVTSSVPINSDDKKVRHKIYSYILHTFLLVIKLIFIIAICFHYTKHSSKQKNICTLTI